MTEQELNLADFEVHALKSGLELLQKENRFPQFLYRFADPVLPNNKRLIRPEFFTYSTAGVIEWAYPAKDIPYVMHIPDAVKANPLLNGNGMRPTHPFQVISYQSFSEQLTDMLTLLTVRYPAVADLPKIIEKIIPGLIQSLKIVQ